MPGFFIPKATPHPTLIHTTATTINTTKVFCAAVNAIYERQEFKNLSSLVRLLRRPTKGSNKWVVELLRIYCMDGLLTRMISRDGCTITQLDPARRYHEIQRSPKGKNFSTNVYTEAVGNCLISMGLKL